MNFSPKNYTILKSRLRSRYVRNLNSVLKNFRKSDSEIAGWVLDNRADLKDYTSLNWHFITQLQTFQFFEKQPAELGKHHFGQQEEVVFEKWNQSEFADYFLKALNKKKPLGKASLETLRIVDRHLVTFGERQILKNDKTSSAYRLQSSLGEFQKKGKPTRLLETTMHLEGKDLRLMTSSLKEMKEFSHRIEIALRVIRKFSPSSWDRFSAFTDVIVPIKQVQLVSYSHQDLPGYSMINLYHRDFVDLMDDLLHENGHHHLNYYLNLSQLIEEPLENIYYSPWRRTLRPLRGIFHAFFTFFWAFKLFADINRAQEQDSIFYLFSGEEKEKMIWRVLEEFYMLEYSSHDLKWARKQGLISNKGWELIQEQNKELVKFKKHIPALERKLRKHKKELSNLKKTLKKAAKEFARD